jgi:hypothetical protein
LLFIIGQSVPLSAALIVMLRRAYSLAPPLTAAMAGLASAAAAATRFRLRADHLKLTRFAGHAAVGGGGWCRRRQ